MSMTPLELALAIAAKKRDTSDPADRNERLLDAKALADTGMFSVPHIIDITGLPRYYAYRELAGVNPRKHGGRFNVEHLELIHGIATTWRAYRGIQRDDLLTVIAGGTSVRMVARLTGIHFNTIYRWLGSGEGS